MLTVSNTMSSVAGLSNVNLAYVYTISGLTFSFFFSFFKHIWSFLLTFSNLCVTYSDYPLNNF